VGKRPRGRLPGWKPTTARQAGILADLLARYQQHAGEGTLPRSSRGIFYDLRPHGMENGVSYRKSDSAHPKLSFGPMEAHQDLVQELLVKARRAELIPEEWVADERAPEPVVPLAYESATDAAEREVGRLLQNFALTRQHGQPVFVEVLCEAGDLVPRLARIAGGFGVTTYSWAGYDGLKGKRAFAGRALAREVPTVVLHVGDYDEDGKRIFTAAAEDAVAWAYGIGHVGSLDGATPELLRRQRSRFAGAGPFLAFEHLALTVEQARAHDLLDADGKAEVDGLPVPVLDRLLIDAIKALQDPACREALAAEEGRERGRLPDAIRRMLPQQ
jgi:hypothetical protein